MKENILLIAVRLPDQDEHKFTTSITELQSLSETAGGVVQKVITQRRARIHPATYIGEGKINEIKGQIDELGIDLVISNDELSPSQLRNLIDRFGVPLIDRSQLILDIFAQRAKTREGQLQVELAQLQYMLPRLYGQGTVLSRLGGGIGTRGPGETKLETDQRHIRRRIDDIKRSLKTVVSQRAQYRNRRKVNAVFQIALVGYTNAGKSTLFNQLTNEKTLTEDQLFATLDPLTRQLRLPSGLQTLITDTVGFIQQLPTTLIAAFKSTLEEVTEADFILHVVDASHHDFEQHQETVRKLLKELNADHIPALIVYNKMDQVDETFIPMGHPSISISAFQEEDLVRLREKIEQTIKKHWDKYYLSLDAEHSQWLYDLTRQTIIEEKIFVENNNTYKIKGYAQKDHPIQAIIKGEHKKT